MHIAVLEDDQDQAKLIKLWLEEAGHRCTVFNSGKDMVKSFSHDSFDLLILDWLVPDMDGLEVLSWVRTHLDWPIPILFVTQRDAEQDVVTALEAGADDYMAKPIKRGEMLARIGSVVRRTSPSARDEGGETVEFFPYRFQRSSREVSLHDQAIQLTQKEYELMLFMFRNAGRILSRGYILETVWGRSADVNTRTVDTHVSRLRNKLSISPENGWVLNSIYQHGYRLEKL